VRTGLLVAFEGIDGAGKTTQLGLLASSLEERGWRVLRTKEPTDGPHGRRLRSSAKTGRLPAHEELELFLQDRAEHVEQVIRPALDRGEAVLVDRYVWSTAAYQGARGLDPAAILERNAGFPIPDLVVLLDVDPRVGLARVRARDERENLFEQLDALTEARRIFLSLVAPPVVRVRGDRAIAEVAEEVLNALGVRADPRGG
jgi:dTMP kinase